MAQKAGEWSLAPMKSTTEKQPPRPTRRVVSTAGEGLASRVDPLQLYLEQLVADLAPHSVRRAGSSAICLGAFARLGKLGPATPRVVRALAAAIGSGWLAPIDSWLCSAALRKTACFEAAECVGCASTIRGLTQHRNKDVVRDAVLALAYIQSAAGGQPAR